MSGPAATERFARHLSQEELRALGAWRDPKAGRWVAPSDSTLCRVVADTDPLHTTRDTERAISLPRHAPAHRPQDRNQRGDRLWHHLRRRTPRRPRTTARLERGHWAIENGNHYRRDASLGEDQSRIRARHAPANNATLNNIALAIVFHRGFRHLPEANLHFNVRRLRRLADKGG